MKVWIGFLLVIFAIASRPRSTRPSPRNVVLAALCVLVAAMLYSYRYI